MRFYYYCHLILILLMNRRKSKRRKSKVGKSNWKVKQPITKKNKPKKMDSLLIWELVRVAAPALGIAVMIVATIRIHNIKKENEGIDKAISATTGTITPQKVSSDNGSQVTVLIGTNTLNVNKGFITNGRLFSPLTGIGSNLPLTFTLDQNGALMVSAKFKDYNGDIVAVIKNNEWEINPNNYFRRNYDSRGLEVIDREGITKFQIEFITNDKIKIGGVFRDSTNWLFVNDRTISGTDVRAINKEEIIAQSELIPDMFKYPADKYFGVRNLGNN